MKRTWWLLVPAAACEVGWAVGLKHAHSPGMWFVTIALVVASLSLALKATRLLPASTVYAVFVGLGTVGSVLVDIALFDLAFQWSTIGFVALLLAGIVSLKLCESD